MITWDEMDRLKRRLLIAGILVLLAAALTVADRLVEAGPSTVVNNFAAAHEGGKQINAAVDALLDQYALGPKAITTWKVMTPDRKLLRLEQRIVVPHDFASVEFNHKLNQQILPYGARVAATERSKENTVTMHIVNDGVIIRTISFAIRPYQPDDQVKEAKGKVTSGKETKTRTDKRTRRRNVH